MLLMVRLRAWGSGIKLHPVPTLTYTMPAMARHPVHERMLGLLQRDSM